MVRLQLFLILTILIMTMIMSQFHYGSITTIWKENEKVYFPNRLNSTMVRLQHITNAEKYYNLLSSQFHYGSITTY